MMKNFLILIFLVCSVNAERIDIKLAALPTLSPDGKTLVFNWHGYLWKVSAVGGKAERLTSHPADDTSPCFSPDGSKIAFVSSREGYRQAYVMDKDGGVPTRIGYMSEGYTIEGWYPDGKSLLVQSYRDNYGRYGRRLYRLPVERAAEKQVMDAGVVNSSLNRKGDKILFSREGEQLYRKGYKGSRTSQIWMFDTKTGDYSELLKGNFDYRSPVWSETDDKFYFVSDESGTLNLWSYEFKTKKKSQLTDFKDDGVILPSISKDGSSIAFRRLFDFYVYKTDKGEAVKLDIWCDEDLEVNKDDLIKTTNSTDIDVTEDGLEIAFTAGFDIWVMDKILREPVRVTETPSVESNVIFSKDSQYIYFIRDDGLKCSVVQCERSDNNHWWQSRSFSEKELVTSKENIHSLALSPKGNYLSYIRGGSNLVIYNLKENKEKTVLKSWDAPSYSWSPDELWMAYAIEDQNFNNDVWIKSLEGDMPAYNISQHPDYDGSPSFSPDGKYLAFSTSRNNEGYEIAYVTLSKEEFEESSRDRTLKKALSAMKSRKKPVPKKPPEKEEKESLTKQTVTEKKDKEEPQKTEKPPEKPKGITIDLDKITDRVKIIKNTGDDYSPFWAGDSSKLAFVNVNGGAKTVQSISLPDSLKPALLLKDQITPVKWLKANDQLYCLYKNVPSLLSRGKLTSYSFNVTYYEKREEVNRNIFRSVWKTMRDRFYDEKMNNLSWEKIREKYEEAAVSAPDSVILDRVIAMLLGELNASHMGYRSYTKTFKADNSNEITAHLGVKFDESFNGPGLKISEVISGSNATLEGVELKTGEVIVEIDGEKCSMASDLTLFLNGPLNRDIELKVTNEKGASRQVVIRPHSYSQIRSLIYEQWIDQNREKVHKMSNDKMGYLHVSRMMWPEFNKFKEEVFKEGNGREGLIIDVRDNGGGFTADHLISVLTQPRHAITVPRNGGPGYPYRRQVYLNWYKPVVVLCNQNSFSNAEIFSHAIKTLKRGKLIGVPTAGGVISTGAANILGKGNLRIPYRGWYIAGNGEDMELNGARPDIIIWPAPGELETGKDVQLQKAIEVLKTDIAEFEDVDKTRIKKASER